MKWSSIDSQSVAKLMHFRAYANKLASDTKRAERDADFRQAMADFYNQILVPAGVGNLEDVDERVQILRF